MANHCFIGKMLVPPWDCTLTTINQPHIHLISRGYLLGISPFKGKQLGYHLGQYHPWDDCIFTYICWVGWFFNGKYTIHGWYGSWGSSLIPPLIGNPYTWVWGDDHLLPRRERTSHGSWFFRPLAWLQNKKRHCGAHLEATDMEEILKVRSLRVFTPLKTNMSPKKGLFQ